MSGIKSKAQFKKLKELVEAGKMSQATFAKMLAETENISALPQQVESDAPEMEVVGFVKPSEVL